MHTSSKHSIVAVLNHWHYIWLDNGGCIKADWLNDSLNISTGSFWLIFTCTRDKDSQTEWGRSDRKYISNAMRLETLVQVWKIQWDMFSAHWYRCYIHTRLECSHILLFPMKEAAKKLSYVIIVMLTLGCMPWPSWWGHDRHGPQQSNGCPHSWWHQFGAPETDSRPLVLPPLQAG